MAKAFVILDSFVVANDDNPYISFNVGYFPDSEPFVWATGQLASLVESDNLTLIRAKVINSVRDIFSNPHINVVFLDDRGLI